MVADRRRKSAAEAISLRRPDFCCSTRLPCVTAIGRARTASQVLESD